MAFSVVTRAPSLRLTTSARLKLSVPSLPASSDDAFLDELIDDASAAIHSFCNRVEAPFARQAYTETLGAFGDTWLMLKGTPLVTITSVLQDGAPLTDWTIEDAGAGIINRRAQWMWTAQLNPGLSGRQSFPAFGAPMPGSEELRFSVSYVSGYLLRAQDVLAKTTISASSADNSFNDSNSAFPALLKAGDVLTVSGCTNAANNGVFTVTGTPTTAKIPVTATLTTEIAGATVTALFRTLPADIEKAAVEVVKSWYFDRSQDSKIAEKQLLQARIRYSERPSGSLPPLAAALLQHYVRAA